jgi:hypothetical protein
MFVNMASVRFGQTALADDPDRLGDDLADALTRAERRSVIEKATSMLPA